MDEMILHRPAEATMTPAEAAAYLKCGAYNLTLAARDPVTRAKLGFPVMVMGNRVRIPRIPFMQFLGLPCEGEAHVSPD